MNLFFMLVVGSPLLLASVRGWHVSDEMSLVELAQGPLQTKKFYAEDGTSFYPFKGIPYAEPPIGDLRFKSPVPAKPWSGVREAYQSGKACPQVSAYEYNEGSINASWTDEDCLFLDVYVPEASASAYPVMVFFHAGGFIGGGIIVWTPVHLMSRDVIVVLAQYRVGILGFLSAEDSILPGNYGLKDQVMALQWVQNNIQAFGGDHEKVTIFGLGAGATSVQYHMLSPMSRGLFHRAIAHSGNLLFPTMWRENHRQHAGEIGQMLSCPDVSPDDFESQALYDCLKKVPAHELVKAANSFTTSIGTPNQIMRPTIDGEFLPYHPLRMLKEGRDYNKVDFMAGFARDDGFYKLECLKSRTDGLQLLSGNFSAFGPAILDILEDHHAPSEYLAKRVFAQYLGDFGIGPTDEDIENAVKMFTDYYAAAPLDILGKMHGRDAGHGTNTYLFEFHHLGQFSGPVVFYGKPKGVVLGEEFVYLFGNSEHIILTRPIDLFMKDVMLTLWTNFARTGNPTPDLSLGFKWDPVSKSDLQYLILNPTPYMRKSIRDKELEFFTNLPLEQNVILFPERFENEED